MPRISVVSVEEAVDALIMYKDIFLKDKALPPYTSQVWQDISNALSNKWNAHSVYVNVRENRRNILTKLKISLNIEIDVHRNINNKSSFLNSSNEQTISSIEQNNASADMSLIKNNENNSTFILYISYDIWTEIKAGFIKYKDKIYGCLKPGVWSDIISDEFWRQFRLPCAYAFKRAKVYFSDNRSHFIVINERCKSKACASSFTAYADTEPKLGENLTLRCITKDTSTIPHEKVKRQLRFQKRQVIGKALVDNGVSNWRRKIATEEMQHGDIEPPLLYESSVLRKLKQEYNDKILGVDSKDGNDPIIIIRKMKHTSPYCGSIHDICIDKVCVHYRSPMQLHIYKEYCRKKKHVEKYLWMQLEVLFQKCILKMVLKVDIYSYMLLL